jgi:hypothetical protein
MRGIWRLKVRFAHSFVVITLTLADFHKTLAASNPTSIFAIETVANKPFNRFIVQHDSSLVSYSLDILGRVGLGQADPKTLTASLEKHEGSNVLFSRVVRIGKRVLSSSFLLLSLLWVPNIGNTVVFASKRLFQSTLDLHVLEAVDSRGAVLAPKRSNTNPASYFRPFGDVCFGLVLGVEHVLTRWKYSLGSSPRMPTTSRR